MDVTELRAIRRHIHQNPELAFEEVETASFVASKLRAYGFDEVFEKIGGTGVVGVLYSGDRTRRTVGLRADMDALPIQEKYDLEKPKGYESKVPGVHHACGHDGHTAMLLGAARYLASHREEFSGTINFIFQPAEEKGGGAMVMMKDGLFDRFPCHEVYGLHNRPRLGVGLVDAFPGPRMAAADRFDIFIEGTGGHGAYPHLTKDPVVASAQVILALQTIVSRGINPFDAVVLSVTMMEGSQTHNVIPKTCHLTGTLRTFTPSVRTFAKKRVAEIVENTAQAFGLTGSVTWAVDGYPPLINHEHQTQVVVRAAEKVVGVDKVLKEKTNPVMGAEDFAFFLQEKPGCYFFLGVGENWPDVHTPLYDFNDEVLETGSKLLVSVALESLAQEDSGKEEVLASNKKPKL